jgi:hypothetical protein
MAGSRSKTAPRKDTTLLERANSSAVKKLLAESNGKIMRATTRQQHGMEFEEWIRQNEYMPVQDYTRKLRVTSYSCALELNTLHGNAEKPFMALDFTSGFWKPRPDLSLEESAVDKPITKSSLSAAESVALWDKVTATLRPRPGAF